MSGLWDRLSGMFGWVPVEDDYEDYEEYEGLSEARADSAEAAEQQPWSRTAARSGQSSATPSEASRSDRRVVKLAERGAEGTTVRVAVAEPQGFGDVQEVAEQLKRRIGVVVNVEALDREVARRVVDFLSGTVYALDGEMQKISAGVVMFVPRDMRIDRMTENHKPTEADESTEEGLHL